MFTLRHHAAAAAALALVPGVALIAATAGPAAASQPTPASCGAANAVVAVTGNHDVYFCGAATVKTAGDGPFTALSSRVHNRIWFHQNANGSGWADCRSVFQQDVRLSGRDQNPGNIQVSANTATC